MDEIIKGLNEEKKVLVLKLAEMTDYHFTASKEKAIVLNARLAIVDKKLDEIQKLLLNNKE